MGIYYRSIQQRTSDVLTIHDYLWRWDTDWFWCSRAFGVQNPPCPSAVAEVAAPQRRLLEAGRPRSHLRPSGRSARLRGRPAREPVVQDIEVPIDRLADVPRSSSTARSASSRSGCARCSSATRSPLAALRVRPRGALRQRRILVDRAAAGRRGSRRGTRQPPDRAGRDRARRPQVALLDRLLRPGDVLVDLWR